MIVSLLVDWLDFRGAQHPNGKAKSTKLTRGPGSVVGNNSLPAQISTLITLTTQLTCFPYALVSGLVRLPLPTEARNIPFPTFLPSPIDYIPCVPAYLVNWPTYPFSKAALKVFSPLILYIGIVFGG